MIIFKNVALIFASISAMNCPEPKITMHTDHPWNSHDQRNYEAAITRCGEKYEKSPCLKEFIKRAEQTYWVICTQEGRK